MDGSELDPLIVVVVGAVTFGYLATVGFVAWLAFRSPVKRPIRLVLALGTVITSVVPIIYALYSLRV